MDKKCVLEDYRLEEGEDQNLDEFIDTLNTKAEAIPYQYRDDARISLYLPRGSDYVHLDVYYTCPSKVEIKEAMLLLQKEGYSVEKLDE